MLDYWSNRIIYFFYFLPHVDGLTDCILDIIPNTAANQVCDVFRTELQKEASIVTNCCEHARDLRFGKMNGAARIKLIKCHANAQPFGELELLSSGQTDVRRNVDHLFELFGVVRADCKSDGLIRERHQHAALHLNHVDQCQGVAARK